MPHFMKYYMTETNLGSVGKSWSYCSWWSQSGKVFGEHRTLLPFRLYASLLEGEYQGNIYNLLRIYIINNIRILKITTLYPHYIKIFLFFDTTYQKKHYLCKRVGVTWKDLSWWWLNIEEQIVLSKGRNVEVSTQTRMMAMLLTHGIIVPF